MKADKIRRTVDKREDWNVWRVLVYNNSLDPHKFKTKLAKDIRNLIIKIIYSVDSPYYLSDKNLEKAWNEYNMLYRKFMKWEEINKNVHMLGMLNNE